MNDRQNQRIRTVARTVGECLTEVRVQLAKIQMELVRLAEAFAIPPGSDGDALAQDKDRRQFRLYAANGMEVGTTETARGIAYYADQLRGSGAVGEYRIEHHGQHWGTLSIAGDSWHIRGPDGYHDSEPEPLDHDTNTIPS